MTTKSQTETTEKKAAGRPKKEKVFTSVGRRKTAVASVFLYPKKGDFLINDKPIDSYFDLETEKLLWMKPFHLVGISHPASSYSASIRVSGSGKSAQFDAVLLALSKALVEVDQEFRQILRKHDLLTRDPREVERKKPFLRKARKAPQYSKR